MHYVLLFFFLAGWVMPMAQPVTDTFKKSEDVFLQQLSQQAADEMALVAVEDATLDGESNHPFASLLSAGRDPFYNAVAFNWNIARFKLRGYAKSLFTTYLNGVPIENLANGNTLVNLWMGLTDVFKSREVVIGLQPNLFSFGNLGNAINIQIAPIHQAKQNIITYSIANKNYSHRRSFTHYSGRLKKGWSFIYSAAWQGAKESYVPGTYMDNVSVFFTVNKLIASKHLLTLSFLASSAVNGLAAAATKEAIQLANNHYYNPNWGFQQNRTRNAAVYRNTQPLLLSNYQWRIDQQSTLNVGALFSIGLQKNSGLDWFNVPDPRPDYYRYLPSFQTDPDLQMQVKNRIENNPNLLQLNWKIFYDVNQNSKETIYNANGINGNTHTGYRSRYIVRDNNVMNTFWAFTPVYQKNFSGNWQFNAGANIQYQQSRYFQTVNDLLGGDFWVNWNQFADQNSPTNPNAIQYNVLQPNRLVKKGEKYGYDFQMNIWKASRFFQIVKQFKRFDFFAAESLSYSSFQRIGFVKNGLFPQNSYGASPTIQFINYAFKSGLTYKLNGKNYVSVNVAWLSKPPYYSDVFLSPRTRTATQKNITSTKYEAVECNYHLNTERIKLRITGYLTNIKDGLKIYSFYDDDVKGFVNNALSNINETHVGVEFGTEWRWSDQLQFSGAYALSNHHYTNRPQSIITFDNSSEVIQKEIVYIQNFKVPGSPQQALNMAATYRPSRKGFITISGNYMADNWLNFNPVRRTERAVQGLDMKSALFHAIVAPEKLPNSFTMNLFAGYQFALPALISKIKPNYLWVSLGITNLLNNKTMIAGGYEQMRFDFTTQNPEKFPARYYYAFGIQYFLSTSYKF